jgi:hypothetical protein
MAAMTSRANQELVPGEGSGGRYFGAKWLGKCGEVQTWTTFYEHAALIQLKNNNF